MRIQESQLTYIQTHIQVMGLGEVGGREGGWEEDRGQSQ